MIYITIPSHRTQVDRRDPYKKFTTFDVHVNGAFHASVRYSAFYQLHEKLIESFGFRLDVPEFPPKKIWRSLDPKVIEDRRESLCRYLQGVIQNQDIAKHMILEKSFLDFQVTSYQTACGASAPFFTGVEIHLPDGSVASVECCVGDPTNVIMKKFCVLMKINTRNSTAFGLFLGVPRNRAGNRSAAACTGAAFDYVCVRWLKNFESPYISLQLASNGSPECRILIRRVTWDPSVEEPLLDDLGCLRMFYLQALSDVETGVMCVTAGVSQRLRALRDENNFRQYVRLCHQQPDYGYELLAPVVADVPQADTLCQLKVGRRQLVLEYRENVNDLTIQTVLRSTRIRVWRVSHTDSTAAATAQMTFQIEYLVGKQEFGLITLHTDQAVILSLFLQSIAAEILREQRTCNSPTFKFDDTISVKAIENLEVSRAKSIVGDNCEIDSQHRHQRSGVPDELFKIISSQMPFDNDSFEDVTDADL